VTLHNFPVEELLWGLGASTLALAASALVPRLGTAWARGPTSGERDHAPVTGLVMTAAALGAISRTWSVTTSTVLGLAGVAVSLAGAHGARRSTPPRSRRRPA
jgi:hypothetical protein